MSIKEIAKRANTSISTVSRVLNDPNYHCNKKGLSEQIWAIAKELDYLPNTAAQNLRKGIRKELHNPFTIDVFLTRFRSLEQDTFFKELYQILKEELLIQGCYLGEILTSLDVRELTYTSNTTAKTRTVPYRPKSAQPQNPDTLAYITQKKNTGLLLFGKCPEELFPILKKRYAYIVGIDRNPTDYLYDEVICNGSTAAEKAMDYLISLGHRSIAYIGDCTYESRYIGYYQALLNHKIPLRHENIHPTSQTEKEGLETMLSILEKPERPSAIFCANDVTAIGVLKALQKKKKKGYVPSVISIDDIQEAEFTTPPLTTISIPKHEMVHLAVALMLDRRSGRHKETVRLEMPCKLIVRESCTYFI